MTFGIIKLYCGQSGKKGFYNEQEIGLARGMKKLGSECVVFYCDPGAKKPEEILLEEKLRVVYVPGCSVGVHGRFDWSILKEYQLDVVQIGSDNQLFVPSLVNFCDKHDIRYYHYVGTAGSDTPNKMKKMLMDLLYRRNVKAIGDSRVFAKTYTVRRHLMEWGITNVDVAHVGLDTTVIPEIPADREALRREMGYCDGERLVLFVGRVDEYKRPFELITLAD